MANSIVQTIREAEIDARSLSEFISKDAYFTVTRRLAPTIHTLDYYLLVLNKVKDKGDLADIAISDTLDKLDQLEPTVIQRVEDAINNTAIEGGVLADTFVVVDGSLSQRTINKGLESIADLSTINNPKDGLRVYVKSYHAGLNKGGGYFTYDSSKSTIDNKGTIINGWVREESAYIDMDYFGGDEYVGEPMAAIQAAIDFVHPTGTVSLKGWTGTKDFDGSISISKPLTLDGNKQQLALRLADNSNLFHSTAYRTRIDVIRITSSFVTVRNLSLDLNKLGNFVEYEGIKYYFLELDSKDLPDLPAAERSALFRYLGTVQITGTLERVVIQDNRFINCSVHAVLVSGGKPMSDFESGAPDIGTPEEYAREITIKGNYISGGCRSGVAFISGVINSTIEGNTAYNWNWAAFRFYFGVHSCSMTRNNVFVDFDTANASHFEKNTPEFTSLGFVGYRVGHGSRAPGSCKDSLIANNNYLDFGGQQGVFTNAKAFRQESGTDGTKLLSNKFVSKSVGFDVALDTTPIEVADEMSLVFVIGVTKSISIMNNVFEADRLYSLILKPMNGEEDNKHKIEVQGNSFLRNNDRLTTSTAIYLGTFGTASYTDSRLPILSINNNIADRYAYFIYSQGALKNTTYISNNNILNVYEPESSLARGCVFPMLGRTLIEGNFISTSSAFSEPLFRAIQTSSIAIGVIKDNTIQAPKTTRASVIASGSNMASFNNYYVDFEGGYLKLEDRVSGTLVKPPATSGTSEQRPEDVPVGYVYFDTTLGLPIYFKSAGIWVDSTGVTV